MATILGSATTLIEYGKCIEPRDADDLLLLIREEAERLNRHIGDLLDMTRLGYGALAPNRIAVDLCEILGVVRNDLKRVLAGHSLAIDTPHEVPALYVDPVLIRQAISNVVENSAKFAALGTAIRITAKSDGDMAEIVVVDEGPGIPEAHRERVFEPFHRVGGRVAGTGLGLSIVKGLVEAHSGTVVANAGPEGRGTAIIFRLPLATFILDTNGLLQTVR